MLKICKNCQEQKEISEFYFIRVNNVYQSVCKTCCKKAAKQSQEKIKYFERPVAKESWNRASKKAYKKHFKKWLCRAKTRYYVKIGKLVKPVMCELYSPHPKSPCYGRIEAHHSDYNKPLLVKWLCSKHHHELEAKLNSS